MHRPIAQLADLQPGLAQLDLAAIGKRHHEVLVADAHAPLGGRTGYRHVLQLAAVDGFRDHAQTAQCFLVACAGRNRQAYQHAHCMRGVGRRRMAATVLDMAVLTGVGIEQRAEPVARGGAGRRDDPGVAEEAVADAEVQPARRREVGGRHRVGIGILLEHAGGTAGQRLAGLGGRRCFSRAGTQQGGEERHEQRTQHDDGSSKRMNRGQYLSRLTRFE